MKSKAVVASITAMAVLSLLLMPIDADLQVMTKTNGDVDLAPISFGNVSIGEEVQDMCVTDAGVTISVSVTSCWWLIRGESNSSIVAWDNEGNLLWSKTFGTWSLMLLGIATDSSYIYVSGHKSEDLYLGKYDLNGVQVWNTTWDSGSSSSEYGLDVILTEEGNIVVTGVFGTPIFPMIQTGFIVTFSSEGEYMWHLNSENYPYAAYGSGYIYLIRSGTILKITTGGSQLSVTEYENCSGIVFSRIGTLYTLAVSDFYLISSFSSRVYTKQYSISRWNSSEVDIGGVFSQQEIWMIDVELCDSIYQTHNISCTTATSLPDGSLLLLLQTWSNLSWQILSITQDGELGWERYILDDTWVHAQIVIKDSGLSYLTGYTDDTMLSMAVFNISYLVYNNIAPTTNETDFYTDDGLLNLQLISITAIGAFLFDGALIVFLRKKYKNK